MTGNQHRRRTKSIFWVLLTLSLIVASLGIGAASAIHAGDESGNLPDVAPAEIGDPPNAAELEDLQTLATQKGISLQAAIDRYAWNDNFALAVHKIREASPEAFTGSGIVDGTRAWIGFTDGAPAVARDWIDVFSDSHNGVSVEVRAGLGFTELEKQRAIEAAHYAVFEAPGVRDASTSFDFATGQITTNVVLESTVSDSVIDDLRAVAVKKLKAATRADILDRIAYTIVRLDTQVAGGVDTDVDNHYGGEDLAGCTSGFGTKELITNDRGISTAGHCGNSRTDDGDTLTFQEEHEGTWGDFQWHTGPETMGDDFYAGSTAALEVNLRDVSSVGVPTANQALCKNGAGGYKDCQNVRSLDECNGSRCKLVEMGERLAASGDSGGPVFWGNAAYGLHQGWKYDPSWPFDRDLFSRTQYIDDGIDVYIATN